MVLKLAENVNSNAIVVNNFSMCQQFVNNLCWGGGELQNVVNKNSATKHAKINGNNGRMAGTFMSVPPIN